MNVLVINCGSSSIKFAVVTPDGAQHPVLFSGVAERLGEAGARLILTAPGSAAAAPLALPGADHWAACAALFAALRQYRAEVSIAAVGHRVVHGGTAFAQPVMIDDGVVAAIRGLIPLAPLHNPLNLLGIEICREVFPDLPQVAVFDTAFHQTLPPHAYRYAVPSAWYRDWGIRRYGFHGTAHRYLAERAQAWCGRPLNLITLHLGNGASACAIRQGVCVDTSMGYTPLEGLIMGSRSGDLDPAVVLLAARRLGIERAEQALLQDSGMRGLCGSSDLRDILQRAEEGEEAAALAVVAYCQRVRKYLGAFYAVLGTVDAVVFSGGVGENAAAVRWRVCEGLEELGIRLDAAANASPKGEVAPLHSAASRVQVLRIRANEELAIARSTALLVAALAPP